MTGSPWIGGAALVAVALLYDTLLWAVRRADRTYPSTNPTEQTWWFGYARDLTNFAGMGGFTAGFALLGIPGPLAVLAGILAGLAGYGLDYVIARRLRVRHATLILAVVMVALVLVAAALRAELAALMASLVHRLF